MFFSAKSKGFFIDQNEHAILIARTSAPTGAMVVEEVRECAPGDNAALSAALLELQHKKSSSGYVHASCGVSPAKRLGCRRRVRLTCWKQLKEPGYMNELVSSQFRVEPDQFALAMLNAGDGIDYDFNKAAQKEVVVCGLPSDEVIAMQDALLALNIYPDRLELTTVATLGLLADFLAFTKSKIPVLVLELGTETTHSFIVTAGGLDAARYPSRRGLKSMIPVVQKEAWIEGTRSRRKKLFIQTPSDFTGTGRCALIKKLVKELQSSIGFYEVQTGQSIGQGALHAGAAEDDLYRWRHRRHAWGGWVPA